MAAMASRTWQISQATCTAETSTTEEISCHDTQAQAWMRAPMNWMISTIPVRVPTGMLQLKSLNVYKILKIG
jgi:hypothetical protein